MKQKRSKPLIRWHDTAVSVAGVCLLCECVNAQVKTNDNEGQVPLSSEQTSLFFQIDFDLQKRGQQLPLTGQMEGNVLLWWNVQKHVD